MRAPLVRFTPNLTVCQKIRRRPHQQNASRLTRTPIPVPHDLSARRCLVWLSPTWSSRASSVFFRGRVLCFCPALFSSASSAVARSAARHLLDATMTMTPAHIIPREPRSQSICDCGNALTFGWGILRCDPASLHERFPTCAFDRSGCTTA